MRLAGERIRWAMVVCVGVARGHGLHGPAKAIGSALLAVSCSTGCLLAVVEKSRGWTYVGCVIRPPLPSYRRGPAGPCGFVRLQKAPTPFASNGLRQARPELELSIEVAEIGRGSCERVESVNSAKEAVAGGLEAHE